MENYKLSLPRVLRDEVTSNISVVL